MATNPNEAPETCAICGYHPDQCTCPVCPECGRQGDPTCMGVHVPYRFTETLVAGGYISWAMYYGESYTFVYGMTHQDIWPREREIVEADYSSPEGRRQLWEYMGIVAPYEAPIPADGDDYTW